MKKELTKEQLDKRKLKETKEISKWEHEKAKRKGPHYLFYLMFIISIVYITDEIATQIGTQMKTEIANDLFSKFGDSSVGLMDIIGYLGYIAMIFAVIYKPLADRFGRKIFLVINTFGMGFGMFLMFLSGNIVMYVLASAVIAFFTPHDMQVVYIMETAPAKHRAKVYSVIKSIATLGVLLIPLMRKLLMTDVSRWRLVYLVPAIVGMVIAGAALIFARESDSFIDHRLSYLTMSDEQREAEKEKKDLENAQGGFINALKFAWGHKQLKWLFIEIALNASGTIMTMYYQVIMTYGYAQNYVESGEYSSISKALNAAGIGPVTAALFMFPIASAVFQFVNGFFADKFGRKPAAVIMTACSLASFVVFYIGSRCAWPPYVVGFLCGATVGSYWASGDINAMMISESSPTNLRASILSAQMVAIGIGLVPVMIVAVILITVLGNAYTGIICFCYSVPGLAASLAALLLKTNETKGMDLNSVRGDEWDDKVSLTKEAENNE